MSVAIDFPALRTSPTWSQFQRAIAYAGLAVVFGCGLYAIETLLLRCRHRFVENPADTMMRAVGLAHFAIGWLFLFTSPRLHNRQAVGRLTGWTIIGIGLCGLFALGGDKNPLMQFAFLSFFFIHEVGDEATLFRQSGELPATRPDGARFLGSLCTSMSLLMVTTLAGSYIVRGHWLGRTGSMRDLPTLWLLVGWACLALLATASVVHTIRRAHAAHGSLAETAVLYRPLLMIYACLGMILLVGSLFGSLGVSLIILVHVMTWLVQTMRRLSERAALITGVWSWLRHSPTGFVTLHLVMMAMFLVLFGLRTHVWQRSGIVCQLLASSWFPYWSIMHIAMAFGKNSPLSRITGRGA